MEMQSKVILYIILRIKECLSRDVVFDKERFGFEKESKTPDAPISFELYDDHSDEQAIDSEEPV